MSTSDPRVALGESAEHPEDIKRVERNRGHARTIASVLTILVAFFVAIFLFVLPWVPEPDQAGEELGRYMPQRDGGSVLMEYRDADGEPVRWESQNTTALPDFRVAGPWRAVVEKHADSIGGFEDIQVFKNHFRGLGETGEVTESMKIEIRGPRGWSMLGVQDKSMDRAQVFEPAILLLPSAPEPGKKWSQKGRFGGVADYAFEGRIASVGPFDTNFGRRKDCIEVETRLSETLRGKQPEETRRKDTYCAGMGLVASLRYDGAGKLVETGVLISTGQDTTPVSSMPPVPLLRGGEETSVDPTGWESRVVAENLPFTSTPNPSTIPPTWVPADPPLVLVAGQGSDLLALDAGEDPGEIRWRFHTAGAIYGPPLFDESTGRVYFGSSDKKLYALDARGLFLWSLETEDNVATRPVISGDTLIFGSEDGNVYGLDAKTGERKWREPIGDPVVSSPSLSGDTVAIGSDGNSVYGLNPANGKERWVYETGGPVEASVVADGGRFYVASRDGSLSAIDAKNGEEIWQTETEGPLRSAPAVSGNAVFVVDEYGNLSAHDRASGRELWENTEHPYAGTPAILSDTLFVADGDGGVHGFGFDGRKKKTWSMSDPKSANVIVTSFEFGPTPGDEKIWLSDDSLDVFRIGPIGEEEDSGS